MEPVRRRLCDFLRERQDDVIGDWTRRMRSLSPARDLSDPAIRDHLPQILMRIADIVESAQTGASVSLENLPKDHAVDRLGRGFDLDQIVTEYSLLRRSILDLWESDVADMMNLRELRNLDSAFDESLRQCAVRFAHAREKLLKTLDLVSEAALGSSDLEMFLGGLLRATLESMEAVDTAVVLLREGDILRVRAAVGLEGDLKRGFSIQLREGVAGYIAGEGAPLLLRHAAVDPRVKSEVIREKGVRALYGVPLLHDGQTIGVAHIGSLSAFEFSEEDKLLFRTMASRATMVIVQAQLVTELRNAVQAREQIIAFVSHDLRNQLGVIATGASLLAAKAPSGGATEAIAKPLETIRRTVKSMQHLLDDLLDMASIQAGQVSLERRVVALKSLLVEAFEGHRELAAAKGIHLRAELAIDGIQVTCDRLRILQVLGNLLGNAIKFCGANDSVTLRAEARPDDVVVAVSDTGPGIPREQLSSVFEAYRTLKHHGKSGGLGLYIAKGIIERHGGRISVESQVGAGTTFSFALPRG